MPGRRLEAAKAAQPAWEALSGVQRAAYVQRIVALIREHAERLARLVVQEQGKPLVEARGEIGGTAGFFEYFTSFARAPMGEIIASDNPNEDIWIRNVPYGVVVGIIPAIPCAPISILARRSTRSSWKSWSVW